MPRLKHLLAVLVSDTDTHAEPQVHFHQGPEMTPAVCYDERCRLPRLDVA